MTPQARYTETVQRLATLNSRIPATLNHLDNEMAGQPGAQTFDPIGRSNMTTVLWCPIHDRDLTACHRDEQTCSQGITIPVHTDPTGDAASEPDHARQAVSEFNRRLTTLENAARWFHDFVHDHQHHPPRKANPVESRQAEKDNEKPVPLCAVCVKAGKAVDVAGAIVADGHPMLACTFHKGFMQRHGRLPNPEEEATHQRGKRVTARVREMDKLRSNIAAVAAGRL